jgi:hypothetical protein
MQVKNLLPAFNVIISCILISFPKLYLQTQNSLYLVVSFIAANLLLYIIYLMYVYKFSLLIVTLCGVVTTVIISSIYFFILKTQPFTILKGAALIMVVIGLYLLV